MAEIAVTGVTGNLGGMVSRLCKENGIKVRNLARNKEKAEKMGFSDVFKSSYDKSEDTIKSLEGIDVLFMVSGSEQLECRILFIFRFTMLQKIRYLHWEEIIMRLRNTLKKIVLNIHF